jgi:hypothetical protein
VELLAGFLLDGFGIGAKRLNALRVKIVLLLELLIFFLQAVVFRALLPVDDHSVRTEHNMERQPDCEQDNRSGCETTPGAE